MYSLHAHVKLSCFSWEFDWFESDLHNVNEGKHLDSGHLTRLNYIMLNDSVDGNFECKFYTFV